MTLLTSPNFNNAPATDFVSNDTAALADHMNSCASSRSLFFNARAMLDGAHSVVCGRMVTVAILVGGSLALLGII